MSGLKLGEAKSYWNKRSSTQKKLTVGYVGNSTLAKQDKEYQEKIDFVSPFINPSLKTLDYGCGAGRWAFLFENYLGVDITENLLNIAKEENPTKSFYQLKEPYLSANDDQTTLDYLSEVEQFFSSTVLQHCDDNLVSKIFETMSIFKNTDIDFVLYETTIKKGAYHNKGRTLEQYISLMSPYFEVKSKVESEHKVHGQPHAVFLIKV